MRSATRALLLIFLAAPLALAAPPHITFMRVVPAAHDLGAAEEIAVLYALGDHEAVRTFVEVFAEKANESETLRITDGTSRGQNFIGEKPDEATTRRIRRNFPADAYLGVNEFTCSGTERTGQAGARDIDDRRTKRTVMWLDATCSARIDIIGAADFRRVSSFTVKGEGTSPRAVVISDDERQIAYLQAAKYAAIAAVEQLVPRRVRESITLDESSPAFEDGLSAINLGRLDEARAVWEAASKKNPKSAALRYNLGAICEALGDINAAQGHYIEARRLSPERQRYEDELKGFIRRNARAARRGPN
ncbi:MAG TPA: hypothetical protein VFN10_10110 [Thermoanaerobaculia bacterium]|nr:hypothetical protein [Thermoanaerobaculia bacterium]